MKELGLIMEPHEFVGSGLVCDYRYSDRTVCHMTHMDHEEDDG